jgi:SAM-dependent methyltransferase
MPHDKTVITAVSAFSGDDVAAMDYNELIALVRETNRPPGGFRSIVEIATNGFLSGGSRVLEIGTSTGLTAVELAGLVGCRVTAIDINERSLEEARSRAKAAGIAHLIDFERRDATDTGLERGTFDMVFCGNVTSLVDDRERALGEYTRVLRDGGFLAAIPMYYMVAPPDDLVQRVSEAIQTTVMPLDRTFWWEFFTGDELEVVWYRDYKFDEIPGEIVDAFVDAILERPHLVALNQEALAVLRSRYRSFMHLFGENLSRMGFTVMLLRKEPAEGERELFTSTPLT